MKRLRTIACAVLAALAGLPVHASALTNPNNGPTTVTGASSLSGTVGYTLDSKDQLTQETSTRNSNYTHNFAYDSAGNPTTFKGSSSTFNSNNQNTAYTFDNNGNPTTYKSTSCTYDVENRLAAYGSALTCGYRGDGLRAWKQPGGGAKTYFLYDGTDVVCELDSSGNLAAHMTYGAAGLVSRRVSSTTTYYAFDAHGSVSVLTDSNGDAVSKHAWDAYGSSIGTAPSGPFGYGAQWGYYTDSETGLCALAYRAYDPATGRFLTRDPIGYAGGVNLYGYVGNGPGSGVDPLGLAVETVAPPVRGVPIGTPSPGFGPRPVPGGGAAGLVAIIVGAVGELVYYRPGHPSGPLTSLGDGIGKALFDHDEDKSPGDITRCTPQPAPAASGGGGGGGPPWCDDLEDAGFRYFRTWDAAKATFAKGFGNAGRVPSTVYPGGIHWAFKLRGDYVSMLEVPCLEPDGSLGKRYRGK